MLRALCVTKQMCHLKTTHSTYITPPHFLVRCHVYTKQIALRRCKLSPFASTYARLPDKLTSMWQAHVMDNDGRWCRVKRAKLYSNRHNRISIHTHNSIRVSSYSYSSTFSHVRFRIVLVGWKSMFPLEPTHLCKMKMPLCTDILCSISIGLISITLTSKLKINLRHVYGQWTKFLLQWHKGNPKIDHHQTKQNKYADLTRIIPVWKWYDMCM